MKEAGIDFDELEQHIYDDSGDNVFNTCPKCGGEYLDTFITKEDGFVMCIDCWSAMHQDDSE